ncbi:glycerophosphoryl diester phosphodiesterase family protein [Hyphomonas polymorpha PS728]|uniref:Glycerophosphoryl diester phosphodiesterase family protein n=1 Tax=Hyphomonas polymorpha PS728 TaxID=1280954 RepID=A0A062VLX3_9PROT|nr:glycerophosphodiester phosphodiesterase family protein [Hyphomonas polymorpha]KDA00672.1 glycerophosphoryl diester phosphodiesterase family protein [Hyphomonas polymorpha PS728]
MSRLLVAGLSALLLAACSEAPATDPVDTPIVIADPGSTPPAMSTALTAPLPDFFNCLRENNGVVVAAHRGGPAIGFPENAIETMQYGFERGIRVFEIDVAESRDGVLFLHHDDQFGRTVDATGYNSDTDWATIAGYRLKDIDGEVTSFHPPKLTDALIWARNTGAIVELDRKKTTSFANIWAAVLAAGAEGNAILISYSDEEAAEIARVAPGAMMTASAFGGRDIERLEGLGVDRSRVIAWTGTREPDPAAYARLLAESVEPAFGTLGRPGERLDDQYWADDDGSEYQRLVDDGVVLIATDEPYKVAEWLTADDEGWTSCATP